MIAQLVGLMVTAFVGFMLMGPISDVSHGIATQNYSESLFLGSVNTTDYPLYPPIEEGTLSYWVLINMHWIFGVSLFLTIGAMVLKTATDFLRYEGISSSADIDGDGVVSDDEETLKALQDGDEEAIREEEVKQQPKKKTKYDIRAEKLEQEIEQYKSRAGKKDEFVDTEIQNIDYHGSSRQKKTAEKDGYLDNFNDTTKKGEDKYSKKGKFD